MGMNELKKLLTEQEDTLKIWREEETRNKDPWNVGYNDGFEDCFKSIKKALEA